MKAVTVTYDTLYLRITKVLNVERLTLNALNVERKYQIHAYRAQSGCKTQMQFNKHGQIFHGHASRYSLILHD